MRRGISSKTEAQVVRRSKLTLEQRRQLSGELQRRMELLKELATLNLKRLAARYGVHHQTVWRLDDQMHGCHIADPLMKRRLNVEPSAGIALGAK